MSGYGHHRDRRGDHHHRREPRRRSGGGDRGHKRGRDDRGGGGGGGSGPPRRRGPDLSGTGMTLEQYELKTEVVRVADGAGPTELAGVLERAAGALGARAGAHEEFLARVLVECGAGLPGKAAVYGTLVGLLNQAHPRLAARVVAGAGGAVRAALEQGDGLALRQLLRFLAELANARAVRGDEVVAAFQRVLDASGVGAPPPAAGEAARASPVAADAVAYAVLAALPSAARGLDAGAPEAFAALLGTVERHMARRESSYGQFLQLSTDPANPAADTLTSMWRATGRARADDWPCASAPRPYERLAARLEACEPHKLEGLAEGVPAARRARRLRPDFRLHDDAHELNAGVHPVDRVIVCDLVADLVVAMRDYHSEAAAAVLGLQLPFSHLHLVVETFFSLLFQLPEPAAPPVELGTLMVDLFKATPAIHPVVGRSINTVFNMVENLDAACRDRFVSWFAFHISHFAYMWAWPAWEPVLKMPESDMRRQTVRQILEAASRLGYWGRVSKTLPEGFVALMPPQPQLDAARAAADAEARAPVMQLFRERGSAEQLVAGLRARYPAGGAPAARALLSALLFAGQKSFSHVFTLADRYLPVLRALAPPGAAGEDARRAVVECVGEYWAASLQHVCIILGRLQRVGVVGAEDVAAWVVARRRADYYHYGLWAVLTQALDLELGVATGRASGGVRRDIGRAAREVDADGEAAAAAERAGPRAAALFSALFGRLAAAAADPAAAGTPEEIEHGTTPHAFLAERTKCLVRRYWRVIVPHADAVEAAVCPDGQHPELAALLAEARELARRAS